MRLDRRWIERSIPHQGSMCLLDEVVEWDPQHVVCRSSTHRAADHPLSSHGRLGTACGIEYAAQAMAVHGALTAIADRRPAAGFLASLRDVRMHTPRLDDVAGALLCEATLIAGDSGSALYQFAVRCAERLLIGGRATVVFDATGRMKL